MYFRMFNISKYLCVLIQKSLKYLFCYNISFTILLEMSLRSLWEKHKPAKVDKGIFWVFSSHIQFGWKSPLSLRRVQACRWKSSDDHAKVLLVLKIIQRIPFLNYNVISNPNFTGIVLNVLTYCLKCLDFQPLDGLVLSCRLGHWLSVFFQLEML